MTDHEAALEALVAVARRFAAAARWEARATEPALQALVETAAVALDAAAASIAVHDAARDRLVFVAAAGPAAGDVVGLEIDAAAGIAGYAFSTGQPLAIGDVVRDPRFDRTVAEATGYVPHALLAVPLADEEGTLGVLEALDRRDGGAFTLRDLDVAGRLARQGALAVRSGRLERDAARLLRDALTRVVAAADADDPDGATLDPAVIDALVSEVTAELDEADGNAAWRLTDRIARLRDADPAMIDLASDWLDALLRRSTGSAGIGER